VDLLRLGSAVWAFAALAGCVVDAADANGLSLSVLGTPGAFAPLFTGAYLPRAWAVTAVCALLVHVLAWRVRRWDGLLVPAWLTSIGLLAPVAVGHVLVGPGHDIGGDAEYLVTLATYAALGGAAVVAWRSAGRRAVPPTTRRRLGTLVAVAGSIALAGEVVVFVFEAAWRPLESGWTGIFFVVRLVALLLAVITGLAVWRAAVPSVADVRSASAGWSSSRGPLWVLLATAAVVIAGRVAETRLPPPQYFVPSSIQEVFLGYDVPHEPTLTVLLTQWRLNLLFTTVAVVGSALYVWGYRRLRRRADAWPTGRLASWLAGWAIVALTLDSGLGRYSSASFSRHMLIHMVLTMVGPVLLVLGGPVTLALRATRPAKPGEPAGPHEWLVAATQSRVLRVLWSPLPVFAGFVGSFYVLYLTPLFDLLMRYHYAHQAMNLHFLVWGYLFFGLVVGVDRPPWPLPHLGRLGFVIAAMPFHAFFAVAVMSSSTIIAQTFYSYLAPVWQTDLAHDQYVGGGIAWAAGEGPLLFVVIVLAVMWSRQDAREAARADRAADRADRARALGATVVDDDLEAYNEMLRRFAERDRERTR
ncbi:MAG TPA: cytochrome c oxidase assembly protein, partial [Kineosporiaceae bacterium]|nr:cytochrome c oxidase assembly protein [Kineosporiaceae bacterium]